MVDGIWLVVASSLCPLLSRPVPSRCHATSFRYRLSLSLVLIKPLRRHVSSRLVVVLRTLTQLVTTDLFDCQVYCHHRTAAATVAVAVPPPPLPPPPPCS